MWLLPASSFLARMAARIFYRLTISGDTPASDGPLLLVANHPNALVDAVLVSAVAERGVRFLGKAPLFEMRRIGWLLRAVGAIPVHRRQDDPSEVARNVHAFEAVFDAFGADAAIGIFPEGISHNEPALARLKTGSARMALGFAQRYGRTVQIVPVGLVLRDKSRFRSEAGAFLGSPVRWEDLEGRGEDDRDAVRELTNRIDAGLRGVTVNLERWEDRPLVRFVAQVWQAEMAEESDAKANLATMQTVTKALAGLRRSRDREWVRLARSFDNHRRRLEQLRLAPADLDAATDVTTALGWTLRRFHVLGPVALVVAAVGVPLYWVPYRLAGVSARLAPDEEDVQSTYKLLSGMVLYPLWTVLVVVAVGWSFGGWAGLITLIGMPSLSVAGLWVRERWRDAWGDVRRYFTLRSRRDLVQLLRRRQRALARDLGSLHDSWKADEPGTRQINVNIGPSSPS